ncbi:MAG: hypothetical protein IKD08_04120, partial [Alphaproteobacteria bacterium]|nr:hypothetical protein [Alphaproteobacteria bacterium]
TECNRVNATANIACRYGYDNSYNNTCDNIINYDSSRTGTNNTVTAANSVSSQCCACCTLNPGDVLYTTNGASGSYTTPSSGCNNAKYKVEVRGAAAGGAATTTYSWKGKAGIGGLTWAIYRIPPGTKIDFANYGTPGAPGSCGRWCGSTGGQGYAAYHNGNLIMVAGGAGGTNWHDGSGNGGGGNACGTASLGAWGGGGGCNGSGGSGGGWAGGAQNGGRGSNSCDNSGSGGGSGYGGGSGGGCQGGWSPGGGGGGGYLRTSSIGSLSYVSGGGYTGNTSANMEAKTYGIVTFVGE